MIERPLFAGKPQFPLGARTKLGFQDSCPLVLKNGYADEMSDHGDMHMNRVSDLDEHWEGYGEFLGMIIEDTCFVLCRVIGVVEI